ncbi:MAG: TIGR01212 family radical SAM protein [Ruminococcus sp.]|nr:TIGR01212 family radical SAM protein [Ruminococcus sp.]
MSTAAKNPFPLSDDNKRYQTYSYYLKHRFGRKVYKVPLNLSLSCPNRDGSKGTGGCKFCSSAMSGEFAGDPAQDIRTQFESIRRVMEKKWQGGLCIPYFQSGSNTYTDTATLDRMLCAAASLDDVAGISIATRADCLDEEKCALLGEYAKDLYLVCELGLQTVHDTTAAAMNRCHTYECFLEGYRMLRRHGVNVCVHIIDGLPGETHEMMLETARAISQLDIHMVKIHLLNILKNTPLEKMYKDGEFEAMDFYDYVCTVADQIELFPKEFIIGRITGDGAKEELIAPMWSRDKFRVINSIDKELLSRDSYQGKRYERET